MAPSDSSFEVVWFYQGDKTITSTVTCERNQSVAGVLTSVLEVNPSGGSIVGEYYCQIRLGNGSWLDPSQSAMQSLVSEVLINQGADPCGADPLSAMSVDVPCALFAENVANDSIVGMDCSTLPVPTTSLPSATTLNTPPSDVTTTSTPTPPDTESPGKSNGLEVWLYVVIAVAAVFAMIIIVLVILCVGHCRIRKCDNSGSAPRLHVNVSATQSPIASDNFEQQQASRLYDMTTNEAYGTAASTSTTIRNVSHEAARQSLTVNDNFNAYEQQQASRLYDMTTNEAYGTAASTSTILNVSNEYEVIPN